MQRLTVQQTSAERTWALRREVLRPHQPQEASRYPGDESSGAFHVEALRDGAQVGVASLYPESRPDRPGGWRLRGMAVTQAGRGAGVGRALLRACLEHVRERGGSEVWCNARSTAAGFYGANGFEKSGPEFVLEGIGPHYLMVLALRAAGVSGSP